MRKFFNQQRSDEALMLRCTQHGDRDAFAVVYARHKQTFYQFLLKLTADPAIAEDVSQQCWLKLLEPIAGNAVYRPAKHAKFTTFLYTLGRNLYIDQFVRRHDHAKCQSLEHTAEAAICVAGPCPDQSAHDCQLAARAVEALSQLPFEQREVISLWASGFSAQAIAAIARVPVNTVLSRKRYAISRLRSMFTQMGLMEADPPRQGASISTLKRAMAGHRK